jgi:hypothetical protein
MMDKPFASFDPAAAQAGKRAGMEQVEASANARWKALMVEIGIAICRQKQRFNTDDMFEIYENMSGNKPTTHENRAMGPVMLHLARQHVCVKSTLWMQSRRRSRHAAPLQVWISLIYKPDFVPPAPAGIRWQPPAEED